ncbi:hypothetical protein [Collinsella stercoris]|uniref:Uncharacterized protein n=1 Tax=Collinsella stercoris DSM 13279 TaxID=445975 RepID=B6GEA2_9ACTN|nr:hypothetical protein [Collinsella stercoris]EEA89375.1 hypothetical protein COLSTE_02439 [Collinsella stercoris DSM 13279]UEA45747.1 hypothetical protein LK434_01200 [Collinsella stercoris DSM 13279]UWP11730.1 hypothetical protein NQ498_00340 [Collinsella stercoris]
MGPSKRSAGTKDDIASTRAAAAPLNGTSLPTAALPGAPLPNAPLPNAPVPAAPPTAPRPRAASSQRVYSPGGCGCALLMAPVVAAGIGLAVLSLGLALLALIALIAAIVLTVREIKRTRSGAGARTGFVIAATVLYVLSLPYLGLFIWFWFVD